MTRSSVFACTTLAAFFLLSVMFSGPSRVAADDDAPLAANILFGDGQVTPDRFNVRAFVPTSSLSTNCFATLSESNFAIPGISVFCAPRVFNGQQGILFSAFFPQPIPSGLILSATIHQDHAQAYGTPVYYPGT